MCEILTNPKYLIVIGLTLDLIGVLLVSLDILSPFKGDKFHKIGEMQDGGISFDPEKDAHKSYSSSRLTFSKWGVALLVLGFFLQIMSVIRTD